MFEFNLSGHDYNHIHFIGIGGISMSGLAEILITEGYKISGTDNKDSLIIERLRNLGASIFLTHDKSNIEGADLIIYTDAISSDNVELTAAKESEIESIDRATFLGALLKNYKHSIAISGTHGKTTTTSMIASITNHGTLNPTVLLGGELDDIGGNVRLGSKEYIVTEACEYKANILKYFPTMAIILNIDEDHLDYFKDMDHIIDTFVGYGKNLEENSKLIINIDDEHAINVIENTKADVITFGINNKADYQAKDIVFSEEGFASFNLVIKNEEVWPINLTVMGIHNIYNSLASMATAHLNGLPMEIVIEHMEAYSGVHRRLEFKGYANGVKVLDDYAHHPTEIRATLEALRNSVTGDIYCIFQPHTFTRTKLLLDSFSKSFKNADKVIITDIYAARENDNGEIHSKDLADAVSAAGTDVIYLSTFDEIKNYLSNNVKESDLIVTMGAGNIYLLGESILDNCKEKTAV